MLGLIVEEGSPQQKLPHGKWRDTAPFAVVPTHGQKGQDITIMRTGESALKATGKHCKKLRERGYTDAGTGTRSDAAVARNP
jgi:hypothetical protein